MKTRDIMTPDPLVVLPTDTVSRAAQLMRDGNVGMLPVVDRNGMDRLVGVITDRDITVRCVAEGHGSHCRVQDHMTADYLVTVDPDTEIHDAVAKMERHQVRRLPVVTSGMRVVGVVSQADIARRIGPNEPELVEELLEAVSAPAGMAAPAV